MTNELKKVSIIPNLPQANSTAVAAMDPLVAMIERAARDPSIDLERLERLMAMQERAQSRAIEASFNEAMSAVQLELMPIARDSNNPQTRSKYASYFAVDKVIRPIYGRHGFRLSFDTADDGPPDHVRVVAILSKGGHSERYHYDSPVTTTGIQGKAMMTLTHAKASAVTYAKRYLAGMIFNLSTGEDTDGNHVSEVTLITQEQADNLRDAIEASGKSLPRFLQWAKVERLEDIRADYYQSCVDAVQAKPAEK